MLRGVAELQRASFLSQQEFNTFSDVAGVSHILIDKRDPDTSGVLQETLRSLAPAVFENDHFVVLENSRAFYPAAFAMNSFSIDEPPAEIASRSLKAAANGVMAVSRRTKFGDKDEILASVGGAASSNPMRRVPPETIVRKNTERIDINPQGEIGWMIIPEAFHPDWKATQGDRALEIAKAYGALLAVRFDGANDPVTVAFHPPWWYFACIWTSLSGWFGVALLLLPRGFHFCRSAGKDSCWMLANPGAIALDCS